MSDKGDKVCPLCTEEMDLTDQQLKPCQCGYEICVWCWNHIMEMAEKDNTEGRCPACRTAYDKERIVGMAANCERMVAEINSERKLKSQKAKPKPSEGRMQLSNVRVIQRNLVYIIGLPLNLADEALLQQREYFGQYGKVLKVSISKTATGVIQHSANNSCCVYITYSKEEEAVRCIQSVHSFSLEGRTLRACFGTTKYCHAWLKNMPCSIPDCLYLHEFGSQEDSFTKDDLVSAFTRSRVQQIIGATNNLHRRAGNILPPPVDEYNDINLTSSATPDTKISLNHNIENCDSRSCANGDTERSNTFPGTASWAMRFSSNEPLATSLPASRGTPSHKVETSSGPPDFRSEAVNKQKSSDMKSTMIPEGGFEVDPLITCRNITTPTAEMKYLVPDRPSSPTIYEDENFLADDDDQGLCSAFSSISIPRCLKDENSDVAPETSCSNHNLPVSEGSQQDVNPLIESSALQVLRESSMVEDLLGFDDQQLKASGDDCYLQPLSCQLSSKQNFMQSGYHLWNQDHNNQQSTIDEQPSTFPIAQRPCNLRQSNGFYNNQPSSCLDSDGTSNHSNVLSGMGLRKNFATEASGDNTFDLDIGESSIISSILSLDMDAWEDTLTSPQSLVRLLGETDIKHGSLKVPSLRKVQESNQSRFSFARQDDLFDQESNLGHTLASAINSSSASNHCTESNDLYMDSYYDISSNGSSMESNGFLGNHPFVTSKFSASKAPTSPPPGFSLPSKAVPPGFPSHGAKNYEANYFQQNSAPSPRNIGGSINGELIDPAIMEVGNGLLAARRSNNPSFDMRPALPHISPFNHDTELQMLMQQPISVKQSPRFPDHLRNRYSLSNDAYSNSISSMLLGQSPPNNSFPVSQVATQQVRNLNMSNGCWGGWDEIKGVSNLGMSELLMNGRLGFNKIVPSHEDLKYQMSGSSNLYNRGFAM